MSLTVPIESSPHVVRLRPRPLTDSDLLELSSCNPQLRLERSVSGELSIIPAGAESGRRSLRVSAALEVWAQANGSGVAFESSAGFKLPTGAVRAPDASWIRQERWDAIAPEEREKYAPLCPDFVVEVRSPSDALDDLVEKMQEYMVSGARLGWLIDPFERRVHVYQPGGAVTCLENPDRVSGDPLLPGFVLNLTRVW